MTDDAPRWLQYMTLDELRVNPRNPKGHDVDLVRRSMGRFGYTQPILLDERTGTIVAGHGRLEILLDDRLKGRPQPEGVTVAADGSWQVPVIRGWASQNDDEANAYVIADNQATIAGGWAENPLALLLEEVARTPQGLDGVGFSGEDVTELLARSGITGDRESDFLKDLAGEGKAHPLGSGGLEFQAGPSLSLVFTSREERQEVSEFLRAEARRREVETMSAAMLAHVREQRALAAGPVAD